jgi:hypothetical protein
MSVFPVVKGLALRATKTNNCGLPIEGPHNRLVTKGFVTVTATAVMNEAEELEQRNAEGKICVSDRTPPTRKYYTPVVTLCNVNTGLIAMFNGWEQILDYADMPIGFQDQEEVDDQFGVVLEVWTGGRADSDCPVPTLDSIFSQGSSGKNYGYFLMGGTEWQLGDIEIGASVSTFTLTGRSIAIPQWGRGPYNVAGTDASGTPGRLLTPTNEKSHYYLFRTPVPPPDETDGGNPVALDISGKFVDPDFYFGGPGNAPAADIAPDQTDAFLRTVSITGAPTGGDFTLLIGGVETAVIAYNAAHGAVKTAVVAVDDGHDAADWGSSGGPLPGTAVVLTVPAGVSVAPGDNNLTGGTSPEVVVA